VEEYLEAPRPGRIVPLNATQRRAVWAVYERLETVLKQRGRWTWEGLRRRALAKVESGEWNQPPYDAVVVDEAQDLDPCALRLLATLCADPSKLFITADANQSIYGGSFRWTDVHDSLKFRGRRTGVIRTNHRSTREIGEAAASYLAAGVLEESEGKPLYGHSGVLPVVRTVASPGDEIDLLARFLQGAARSLRLTSASGAILVPSKETGRPLAAALKQKGLPAEFMPGTELDLRKPCVKVITLKSAKGLEFPVVALAGFVGWNGEPKSYKGTAEEEEENLRRERRSMFVGMTRAMRALLVVVPARTENPLLKGFTPDSWNVA
jgi:superfamily I DNA/RNA helicase